MLGSFFLLEGDFLCLDCWRSITCVSHSSSSRFCRYCTVFFNVGVKHVGRVLDTIWWLAASLVENFDCFGWSRLSTFDNWEALVICTWFFTCIECLDTVARQAAMVFKCGVLIYYKNSRGRNYRRQVTTWAHQRKLYDILSSFEQECRWYYSTWQSWSAISKMLL